MRPRGRTLGAAAMQCEFSRQFFDMMAAIAAEQKTPREFSGQVLYSAEISLLDKIDEYPDSNVSMLSARSNVTRSAVTQMTGKLLAKGLIEQYQSPRNKKEKYFRLTETGRQVRQEQAGRYREAAQEMCRFLCSLSEKEKNTLLQFMHRMKDLLPISALPCQCSSRQGPCFLASNIERTEQPC